MYNVFIRGPLRRILEQESVLLVIIDATARIVTPELDLVPGAILILTTRVGTRQ